MKIAVISEFSASERNPAIIKALEGRGHEVYNVGMHGPDDQPNLSYLHTGLLAGLLLNAGAVDLVVGGCGTGVGFQMAASMYPGVYSAVIQEPLDAWLFAQINAGNCVSLPLNQNFGWAADVRLRHVFDRVFEVESGAGYPPHRSEPQRAYREQLAAIGTACHRTMREILPSLDPALLQQALKAHCLPELLKGTEYSYLLER